jgi:ribose transport system permease protein
MTTNSREVVENNQISISNNNNITIGKIIEKYNTIIIFIILIVVSSFLSESFFTRQNIYNILRQQAATLCLSMGMLMVLLLGEIDLAAGATAGLSGMIFVLAMSEWGFNGMTGLVLALLLTLGIGVAVGLLEGLMVSRLKLAAFIVTLAFQTINRGITYILSNGQPIRLEGANTGSDFWIRFGSTSVPVIGLPWVVVIVAIFAIVFSLIMKYTEFGRLIIATGSNKEAVRLSGININKYRISGFILCSVMSAVGGLFLTARASIAVANAGVGYELDAIAGCIIGGTSLFGGKGTIVMAIIGTLILGLISNIMNLMSIASYPQQVIKGVIILLAVIMQMATDKRIIGD